MSQTSAILQNLVYFSTTTRGALETPGSPERARRRLFLLETNDKPRAAIPERPGSPEITTPLQPEEPGPPARKVWLSSHSSSFNAMLMNLGPTNVGRATKLDLRGVAVA